MKQKLFILLTLIFLNISLWGQPGIRGNTRGVDFDKYKAEKVSFITEAVELTPQEAQLFWPLYNELEKKRAKLYDERHQIESKMKEKKADFSEEEFAEITRKMTSFPLEEGKLRSSYNEKFLKVLPASKVFNLYVSEIEFRKNLLRKWKQSGKEKENKGE